MSTPSRRCITARRAFVRRRPRSRWSRPGIPQDVRVAAGNANVLVSWAAVPGASSYRVYGRDVTASQPVQLLQWDLTANSWRHALLTNGHRYEYSVSALNGGAEGTRSVAVGATPNAPIPAAPGNVRASVAGASITVSWSGVAGAELSVYARDRSIGENSYRHVQWNLTGTSFDPAVPDRRPRLRVLRDRGGRRREQPERHRHDDGWRSSAGRAGRPAGRRRQQPR